MTNSSTTQKKRRRAFVAIGVGAGVAAVALASAAGLGGIIVEQIGAESAVVADPFTDGVTVTWGTPVYDATIQQYVVEEFTVSRDGGEEIPAGELRVTVADEDGVSLGEGTATTDGTSNTEVFTLADSIPAHDVENVAVVLHSLP
jgi:hypothetical protein